MIRSSSSRCIIDTASIRRVRSSYRKGACVVKCACLQLSLIVELSEIISYTKHWAKQRFFRGLKVSDTHFTFNRPRQKMSGWLVFFRFWSANTVAFAVNANVPWSLYLICVSQKNCQLYQTNYINLRLGMLVLYRWVNAPIILKNILLEFALSRERISRDQAPVRVHGDVQLRLNVLDRHHSNVKLKLLFYSTCCPTFPTLVKQYHNYGLIQAPAEIWR